MRHQIHEAIEAEWQRRVSQRVAASPEEHVRAITDAVWAVVDPEVHRLLAHAKAQALRDFSDAHTVPWTFWRQEGGKQVPLTLRDLLQRQADRYIEQESDNG